MLHGIPNEHADYNLGIYLPNMDLPVVDMSHTVFNAERDGDGRFSTDPCFGEVLLEKSNNLLWEGNRNDDDG